MANKNPKQENLKSYKPGESGNPKGRPKGAKSIETILRELMEVKMSEENPMTGKTETVPAGTLMYAQLMAKAAKDGDLNAIDKIMDRLEGKAVAKTADVTEKSFMENLEEAKKDG